MEIGAILSDFLSRQYKSMKINKTNWSLVLVNSYTVLLLGLFLSFKAQSNRQIFILFILVVNVMIFIMTTISDIKILRIHYLVGKSRRQMIREHLLLDFFSQLLVFCLFWFASYKFTGHVNTNMMIGLFSMMIALVLLKASALYLLIRKLI